MFFSCVLICICGFLYVYIIWFEDVVVDCFVEGGKEIIGKVYYLVWGIYGMVCRWFLLMNMGCLGEVWGIEVE